MKNFFVHLRPMERRLVVGALVIFILVLNWWLIWPHFSDWGKLHDRLDAARQKLALYQKAIAGIPKYRTLVKGFENQGEFVPEGDQSINFLRSIQSQASASGVGIINMGHDSISTNEFFIEQKKGINVNGNDQQIVDFLYKLGSSASMIRVRDLELQPDGPKQKLNANIQLVASYQKIPAAPEKSASARPPANTFNPKSHQP